MELADGLILMRFQWYFRVADGTSGHSCMFLFCLQAEEERDDMERVKLDNKRILFNLLPAHVAQHFLMSNPRNMVSPAATRGCLSFQSILSLPSHPAL